MAAGELIVAGKVTLDAWGSSAESERLASRPT